MQEVSLEPMVKKKLSDFVEETLSNYIGTLLEEGQTKLPPEVELAQILSVSRTTIRRALSDLENKGVILRIHGKGTFINPNLKQTRLNLASTKPLLQLIELCGFSSSVQLLYHYTGEPSPLQKSALHLNDADMILTVCKVYYADKEPAIVLIDYIPTGEIEVEPDDSMLLESTFDLIRRYSGILCVRDEVQISAAGSNALLPYTMGKEILHCDSVLCLDIMNYTENGDPVFITKQFFNTDYIRFHLTRTLEVYR